MGLWRHPAVCTRRCGGRWWRSGGAAMAKLSRERPCGGRCRTWLAVGAGCTPPRDERPPFVHTPAVVRLSVFRPQPVRCTPGQAPGNRFRTRPNPPDSDRVSRSPGPSIPSPRNSSSPRVHSAQVSRTQLPCGDFAQCTLRPMVRAGPKSSVWDRQTVTTGVQFWLSPVTRGG